MGEFSFDIAKITQGNIQAFDIPEESIRICKKHQTYKNGCDNLTFQAADIETLQLPEKEFDVICMSGSLSCINLDTFLCNLYVET